MRNQRGFSLIELLVVAAVFGLMVLMVDAFFITVNRGSHTVELAADVQQNARIAVERLSRELRESQTTSILPNPLTGSSWVAFPSARHRTVSAVFCLDASGANVDPQTGEEPDPPCLPPQSPGSFQGTFAPVPQTWVVYWWDISQTGRACAAGTGALLRGVVVQQATPSGSPPAADGRAVATCVELFDVSKTGAVLVITLDLAMSGTVQGTVVPPQRFSVTDTIFVRN